jgi:hypothetical protein
MIDMTAVSAIGNSLNVALNISKTMLGIRDQAMIQEKVVELTSQIISAHQNTMAAIESQRALTDRVRELEAELETMRKWDAEKENYQLTAITARAYAYALKPEAGSSDPPHWLCPTCFLAGKKSFLQDVGRGIDMAMSRWKCSLCSTTLLVDVTITPNKPNTDSAATRLRG